MSAPSSSAGRSPVDLHIGCRLRALRREAGLSLDQLAAQVGIAFQQLQKYETGTNRVSAAMLLAFARVLGRPVTDFYLGLLDGPTPQSDRETLQARLDRVLAEPGGCEVVEAVIQTPAQYRTLLRELAVALRSRGATRSR